MRLVVIAVVLGLTAGAARAQQVELSVESREIYAGLPFVLAVTADGFDEAPEPKVSDFAIAGVKVSFLGASPNVSSSIQIINGVRSESRRVSFVYRYRIEASEPGTYRLPAITVSQGTKKANTAPAEFRAERIADSGDMKLSLGLPDRPVWVGETFEMTIDWFLRRDPKGPNFVIPLFDREDTFTVRAPDDAAQEKTLGFQIGSRGIELPYTATTETMDGAEWTRLSFRALVTPKRAGTLDLGAAKVVTRLQTGVGRDSFGFRVPRTGIFKAEDRARTLEVKALPVAGRPDSFANAVGSAFSIDVQASRTVVQVGDPIELAITVRGDSGLDGISLPRLDAKGGLAPELFTIPDEAPAGEVTDNGKRFVVTVRLKSADAREIPPIKFSYFDPKRGEYKTAQSNPIALSVAGSAMVGARDVVGGARQPEPADPATAGAGAGSQVGADLSLSAEAETLSTPLSRPLAAAIGGALAALALIVLATRMWHLRTRGERQDRSHVAQRVRDVERELAAAETAPGRDAAPRVVSALRALARAVGAPVPRGVIQELETVAYDPNAAALPLAAAVREQAQAAARELAARPRAGGAGASTAVATVLVGTLSALAAGQAWAAGASANLAEARQSYRAALDHKDREVRTRAFRAVERQLAAIVADHPDRPELLTDWGNAALGAGDLGHAVLAYRRALAVDGSLDRARRNLAWVRERAPAWLARPKEAGAVDALFFWHRALTSAQRILIAGIVLALAIALATPWGTRRDRMLRRLALVPLAVFVALAVSLLVERDTSRDAVMVAEATLRAADSEGAPPALPNPLPAGAEAIALEQRDGWTRLELADGTRGWVHGATVERVSIGSSH